MSALSDRTSKDLAFAGRVQRYHVFPTHRPESVGEHTWRVATIYLELFGVPENTHVLPVILMHDVPELGTGDIPFLVKRRDLKLKKLLLSAEQQWLQENPVITNIKDSRGTSIPEMWNLLEDNEKARVKVCDCLQMVEFACIEQTMGNKFADTVRNNAKTDVFKNILSKLTENDKNSVHQWLFDLEKSYFG